MERILIIGCPGSGKSQCSKRLGEILGYPILHLDRIYHIDNQNQISKVELDKITLEFISKHERFIIDGNYASTLESRMRFADTIIYFDIDLDTCINNVLHRTKSGYARDDIAPGFDNTILDPEFIKYIETFRENVSPRVDKILQNFPGNIVRINNYNELENFYNSIILLKQ